MLFSKDIIKQALYAIFKAVGLPVSGVYGFIIKYIVTPLVHKAIELGIIYGKREVDRSRGKDQAKKVEDAKTKDEINSSFNGLD